MEYMKSVLDRYPPLLNVKDVAEILGITCKTVRRLVNSKTIKCIRIGKLIRIPKNELFDYLENS